jgi:hypothetical protein
VVQTVLGDIRLLADVFLLLAVCYRRSLLGKTLLLLSLGLRAVLVEDLEGLRGQVAVGDVLELSNRRWDLQAHVENFLLALEADVSRPLDHAPDIALGLNVLADSIVARLEMHCQSESLPTALGGRVVELTRFSMSAISVVSICLYIRLGLSATYGSSRASWILRRTWLLHVSVIRYNMVER